MFVVCVLCVCCVCCVCDDELKLHSNMCVHECARCATDLPSWPTNWTAQLGSTTGQHHWPALLTPLDRWPPPLVSTTGRHHWPGPFAACSKHVGDDDDDDDADADDDDYDDADDDDDDDDGDDDDGDE